MTYPLQWMQSKMSIYHQRMNGHTPWMLKLDWLYNTVSSSFFESDLCLVESFLIFYGLVPRYMFRLWCRMGEIASQDRRFSTVIHSIEKQNIQYWTEACLHAFHESNTYSLMLEPWYRSFFFVLSSEKGKHDENLALVTSISRCDNHR